MCRYDKYNKILVFSENRICPIFTTKSNINEYFIEQANFIKSVQIVDYDYVGIKL